jgi:hypothetical protein
MGHSARNVPEVLGAKRGLSFLLCFASRLCRGIRNEQDTNGILYVVLGLHLDCEREGILEVRPTGVTFFERL